MKLFWVGYETKATAGGDYVTKKGFGALIILLEKYERKGGVVLFESILASVRFGVLGEWLCKRLKETVVVVLDVSLEDCLKSLHARQAKSDFSGGEKHIRAMAHQFSNTQKRLKLEGFRMEYVDRLTAVPTILKLLAEKV